MKYFSLCILSLLILSNINPLIYNGTAQEPAMGMEGKMIALDISDAKQWIAHTDWLGNPAEGYNVSQEENVMAFSVRDAGQGMKWSRHFREPIDLTKPYYIVVDYRAVGVSSYGDYFLYIDSSANNTTKELYVIMPGDLEGDGRWRKAVAQMPNTRLNWMAIQVQAKSSDAKIQIKSISLTSEKPSFSISDVLELGNENVISDNSLEMIDLSKYYNANSDEKLSKMGLDTQWFKSERITADGIPFKIAISSPNLISTKLDSMETISIPINKKVGEIYLLLGAYYEGNEEPSIGNGKLTRVTHVERFIVEIEYSDGIKDFVFPFRVGTNLHTIEYTMGVYCIVPTRHSEIKEIKIHDEMRQGEFYLAGLTISGKFKEKPEIKSSPQSISKKIIVPDVLISADDHNIKLNNGYLQALINTEKGLVWTSLVNGWTGAECLKASSPLFAVTMENKLIASSDFKVKDISIKEGKAVEFSLVHDALNANLTISFNEERQLEFALKLTNVSDKNIKITPSFISLNNVFISDAQKPSSIDDQWYCYPRRGSVVNNVPASFNDPYSGLFPMQFLDVYHPQLGGIYIMKQDLTDEYKWFKLKKDSAISLSINYMEKELKPDENITLPEVVIGTHAGDWHDALTAYRNWVKSWYQPTVARKNWFREIFNFRQQFMHFALPKKSGIFDNDTKAYHFGETMEKDISDFGGVDYLHIFDWGWSKEFGRCGDYDHWEQIGGVEAFRKAIAETQAMSIPVGLYIEGYLVDPESNLGKAHGEEWQLLDRNGKPYTYFAPSYNICPAVKAWQDYLFQTYARVWRETGVNGFYVDEMGFADPGHFCYNPDHGHPVPEAPLRGQRDLVRKIREALPLDVAVYTEEIPTDVNSQYQDGSFTYSISSVSDNLSPTHLNLYRFAFPDFKTFEIITCDRPLGSDYQSVKRIFFNGEGIWIEGIAKDWFTPETRACIAKTHEILKAHVKAFTSANPIPLIPTLIDDIYANEFPADDEKVWTIYNARYSTIRGELFAVPHKDGATYYDAWNRRELKPRIHEGKAYINMEIGPKDVGCLVQK